MNKKWVKTQYEHYFRPLVNFAYQTVDDFDVAQDLVQDIFAKMLSEPSHFKIDEPRSYLYKAVHRKTLDYLKTSKARQTHHQNLRDVGQKEFDLPTAIEENEQLQRIYLTIENLPDKCKAVFKASRFEGLSNDQIADQQGISKRTVETQISNALKQLRRALNFFIFFFH